MYSARNFMARKRTVIKENYMILCSEHKSNRHESGTEYYVSRHIMDNLLDSEPVNETICKITFKLKYYILTINMGQLLALFYVIKIFIYIK